MLILRVDESLELRSLEPRHAPVLFRLTEANRAYLREWMPWLKDQTVLSDTRRFIRRAREGLAETTMIQTGIWLDDELVGAMGINRIDALNRRADIGYWISQTHQGHGLVTRGCHRLLRYGFEQLDLHKLEIHCDPRNHRSRAVATRLGFIEEGTLREALWLNDHFTDLVVYGLLFREWEASRS